MAIPPAGARAPFGTSAPKDDGWKSRTLAYMEQERFKLEPICRNCWHRGAVMTPH